MSDAVDVSVGSQVTLRACVPGDREFLETVYASTRLEELAMTDWSLEQKVQFCLMQFNAQDSYYRENYPTAQFLVIERGGQQVGRLYVDRWPEEIRIMDIALLPQFRGNGTGTFLLRNLMDEARQVNKVLSIHVEKFNPAQNLYLRLGFKPVEDKGVYLLMHWRPKGESATVQS